MGTMALDALRTTTLSIPLSSTVSGRKKYDPSTVSFRSTRLLPIPLFHVHRTKSHIQASTVILKKQLRKEIKQFDESKVGVKGLVDSGVTSIPRIFHQPPENLPDPQSITRTVNIPIIDLAGDRSVVIRQVQDASSTFGFFQIINHGIALSLMDDVIFAIKAFNELTPIVKSQYYGRQFKDRGVLYYGSNLDLHESEGASWNDTLLVVLGLEESHYIPDVCRAAVVEWDEATKELGDVLLGLMSEGLGLKREALEEKLCMEARIMAGNYYPYCPQPDLTVGLKSHTDPVIFTVLLSNQIHGLQVKIKENEWANLMAVPGALVVNVGDVLQIISNDKYRSVEHRVLANSLQEPRISVAVFFNPADIRDTYGPLPEITSSDEPARYRSFDLIELAQQIKNKNVGAKTLINKCRLDPNSKSSWDPFHHGSLSENQPRR